MVTATPGSRRRARMLITTSLEWTPPRSASSAGGLDRSQAVGQHRAENLDHLAVAVVGRDELAAHALDRGGQHPVLERRAVAQCAGHARQHRDVVPRVVDRLAAAVAARVLGDDR